MGRGAPWGIVAAGVALLLFAGRAVAAEPVSDEPGDGIPDDAPGFENDGGFVMPDTRQNLRAFLFMIRSCENSDARFSDDDRYFVFYGQTMFSDTADHPVITGEKRGVPLSAEMCRAAGFSPGCVSTAAGAYQIIKPTWQRVREAGAWGQRLGDFEPGSQDEAARRLLIECGALPLVDTGDIRGAIAKASKLWASLPGSSAKQRPKTVSQALGYFYTGLSVG